MKRIMILISCFLLAFAAYGQDSVKNGAIVPEVQDLKDGSVHHPAKQKKCLCTHTCKYEEECLQEICRALADDCNKCIDENFIVYDFKTGNYFIKSGNTIKRFNKLKEMTLKYHEAFKFKIVNVNRYLYKVDFQADDVKLSSTPSPILENLFLGTGAGFLKIFDQLTGFTFAPGDVDGGSPLALKYPFSYTNFQKAYDDFRKVYNELVDKELEAFSICKIPTRTCCTGKGELPYTFSKVDESYNNMVKAYLTAKEEQQKIINKKKDVDQLREQAKECDPKTLNCDSLNADISNKDAAIDNAQSISDNIDELYSKVVKPAGTQLQELVLFNNNLVKENFSFVSPTIYPEGNMLEMKLTITPDANKSGKISLRTPLKSIRSDVGISVKMKPMLSFSTGFFVGLGSKLQEKTYSWEKTPIAGNTFIGDSVNYNLVATGYEPVPLGISALMNFYLSKWPCAFMPIGLSIGAGLTAEEKPKPVYMGGLSFIFGNERQVLLTFGSAMMYVKNVKQSLYSEYTYRGTQGTKPSAPSTGRDLKVGYLLSLTYTPFTNQSSSRTSTNSNRQELTPTPSEEPEEEEEEAEEKPKEEKEEPKKDKKK